MTTLAVEVASSAGGEALSAPAGLTSLMWLLIVLPLVGAAVLLLSGRRSNRWGHWFAIAMMVAAFALASGMFFEMLGRPAESRGVTHDYYEWILAGLFKVNVGLQLDQLSMVFVLLITGVGMLIHFYSVGYMSHDPDRRKFFGFLNLFVAAMLTLVLANNYLLLYVGWEGVGLASFLLISFWQHKPEAAAAGKKAFIVNRVGDMGLSLAIMLTFVTFGSVAFSDVFARAGDAGTNDLTWIGLLLLVAACGKSAQFPLQSWLLDAMEGPTPVSALIHAATMVTAGVYLIVRSAAIFDNAPVARVAVITIGAITLMMGAIIGCAKDDIKKALAGSTMSQIGYMILAAGLGPIGYVFAIFHLLMHGFFKADMFLGAGSVKHAMNDQVDMRRFGALRGVMAVTFLTFAAGYLAIIGVPPFDGFYSKDPIIAAAFAHSTLVGLVTLLGAGITAFYMTRLFVMTFLGKERWTDDAHPHESSMIMLVPMAILGVLSAVAGFTLASGGRFEKWLEPVTGFQEAHGSINHYVLEAGTLGVVAIGVVLAALQYRRDVPLVPPIHVSPLTVAARNDLYGDAFNEAVFMRPGQWLTRWLVWFDNRGVDGAVNGIAATLGGLSGRMRKLQTGYSRSYALSMLGGAILVIASLVLVRL